jgi:hypothetical protein
MHCINPTNSAWGAPAQPPPFKEGARIEYRIGATTTASTITMEKERQDALTTMYVPSCHRRTNRPATGRRHRSTGRRRHRNAHHQSQLLADDAFFGQRLAVPKLQRMVVLRRRRRRRHRHHHGVRAELLAAVAYHERAGIPRTAVADVLQAAVARDALPLADR